MFSNLIYLGVKQCKKISCLFSPSSSASLVLLQELEICDCENILEIVSKEEIQESRIKIVFPRLQYLKLERLSNLRAFCQGSYDFHFPSLQEVLFGHCHSMEVFSYRSPNTPKLRNITMEVGNQTKNIWMGDLNVAAKLSKGIVCLFISFSYLYICICYILLKLLLSS